MAARKAASSSQARAAGISTSSGAAANVASARNRAETSIPRDTSIWRIISTRALWTPAMSPSARPRSNPCRRCERNSGSSSGPVPSRAPSTPPTRSSTALVRADGAASFSTSWISAAVQPPEDTHGISRTGRLLRAGRVAPSATTLSTAIVSFSGSGVSPFWAPKAAMLETPFSLSVASTASRSR